MKHPLVDMRKQFHCVAGLDARRTEGRYEHAITPCQGGNTCSLRDGCLCGRSNELEAASEYGKEVCKVALNPENIVGAFCFFAAGMLTADVVATLVATLRYHWKRREARERCDGERASD